MLAALMGGGEQRAQTASGPCQHQALTACASHGRGRPSVFFPKPVLNRSSRACTSTCIAYRHALCIPALSDCAAVYVDGSAPPCRYGIEVPRSATLG